MLCRLLLIIVAFSYLICVLVLSGMQKEDLDLNLLRKLQRRGVDTEELNNEKLRQECLSKGSLDNDKPNHINESSFEQKNSTMEPYTITDASNTKGNDILRTLDEIDMETVIKYFKSTQKPIPETDTPFTENIISINPTHTTQGSEDMVENIAKVTKQTLVNDTSNSPIIEYQEDQPTLDSVLKFWQTLIKKNKPEKIIYLTTRLPETMTDIITDLEQNSHIYKINPTKRSLNYGRYELPTYGNSYSVPEPTTSSFENINSKEVERMSKMIAAYLSRKHKNQMQYSLRQKRKEDVNDTTHQVTRLEIPQKEQNDTKSSIGTSYESEAMQKIQKFLEGKVQNTTANNDTSSFKDIFYEKSGEKTTIPPIIDSSPTNSPTNHENYFKEIPMSLIDAKFNSELEQRINSKLKSFIFNSEPVTSNTPLIFYEKIDEKTTVPPIIDSSPTNSLPNHENYFKEIPLSLIDAKINSELEQRISSKLKSFIFNSEPVTSNTPLIFYEKIEEKTTVPPIIDSSPTNSLPNHENYFKEIPLSLIDAKINSELEQRISSKLKSFIFNSEPVTSNTPFIFYEKIEDKTTVPPILESSPTNSLSNHENYFKEIPMSLIDAKINSELEQRFDSKLKSFIFNSEPVTSNTPFKTQFQIERQDSYKYDNEQKEFDKEPFVYTDVQPKPKNDNYYNKPDRGDQMNNSGIQLSLDVIKQIAETVKEMVLKEVRKEITTTTSSTTTTTMTTTTTTTQSTTSSRTTDAKTTAVKKVDEDKLQRATQAIEKFIKLLENFKPVKEPPATTSTVVTVTTTTESSTEKFRIKVMYPQVGAVNPYGIPGHNQMPKFPPIFSHPYIDPLNSQIPLAPMNIFANMQHAPMVHILQDKPHPQPVMIQTNGEIPPLQIPIMEPVLLNRHIVLTTQLPQVLTENERERWAYIMKYGRNPDTRDERQKRIETLSGYSNNEQNQRFPEFEHGSIRDDTNKGGTLMNRSPFTLNYLNQDNNNRKINYKMQVPASQKSVQDIRGFHERLEGGDNWNRDSYPYEQKNYNEPKERYIDRKERYNEPNEGYNSPTERFVEHKGKEYSKNIDVVSRQQVSLNNKRGSKFDDTHFQNFLKTQQKVNDMLERILSGGKSHAARSVEIP